MKKFAKTAHLRGAEYERAAAEILRSIGYNVLVHDNESTNGYDLLVNGLEVEVKGARQHSYNGEAHAQGFQFAIRRASSDNEIHSPIVVLYCKPLEEIPIQYQASQLFVVPLEALAGTRSITIPNALPRAYRGKWSKFYMRFDLLDSAIVRIGGELRPNAQIAGELREEAA